MSNELALMHERVDDIPLLIGVMERLGLAAVIDETLGEHWLHQGLSNGWLAVVWIAYILSEGDHRKSSVQGWVAQRITTLSRLLGQPLRSAVEANDDRLGILLRHLSDDHTWATLEAKLWAATLAVYDLTVEKVWLDGTTVSGYHTSSEYGLMQLGHSKDHRPDLAQVKLMAAAAEPNGQWLACDVVAGQRSDAVLYTPLIQRVRALTGRRGLLYTGDCKMAGTETRAELVRHGDYYVTIQPPLNFVKAQYEQWVERAVTGEQPTMTIKQDEIELGIGYEFVRSIEVKPATKPATKADEALSWDERTIIYRSLSLLKTQVEVMEERLRKAEVELMRLTPPVGRGHKQHTTQASLDAAIAAVLDRYQCADLLTVTYQREEQSRVRSVGRGRKGPHRPTVTETKVRYVITAVQPNQAVIQAQQARLGWRCLITNLPVAQMSMSEVVCHYRNAPVIENTFHQLKDRPLGIRPLYVRTDEQICGLTRLLTLALRILTLIQSQVRRSLQAATEEIAELYDGQPKRTTSQPTTSRLLKAVARQQVTLTQVTIGPQTFWHLTPLPALLLLILRHLNLPPDIYTQLALNSQ